MEKERGTWRVLSPVHPGIQFEDRVPLVCKVHSFLCNQFFKKVAVGFEMAQRAKPLATKPSELSHRVVGENSSL